MEKTVNAPSQETTPLLTPQPPTTPKKKPFPLNIAPACAVPYLELARVEKPTGTILLLWSYLFGLTMAAYQNKLPIEKYLTGVLSSSFICFVMRRAGCTINDIWDRNMDAGVERCKTRPLASGRVTLFGACAFLFAQYAVGAAFFYYTTEGLGLWIGLAQLLPFAFVYPLMKRFTHFPQAWLGFAMNLGYMIEWMTVNETRPWTMYTTFLTGMWCWTMYYDTVYACQDKKDDMKVGVKSTAIIFGDYIKLILIALGLSFVGCLYASGVQNKQGPAYFVITVGGTLAHLGWQYYTVDLDVPKTCAKNFIQNGHLGLIIWGGMMVDYLHAIGIISY